jgi:hypothetical protein
MGDTSRQRQDHARCPSCDSDRRLRSKSSPDVTVPTQRWWKSSGNRILKEANVRRYHYDSHHQLRQHIAAFLDVYNFASRLNTLKGFTPFECICAAWTKEPDCFRLDPIQLTPALHT